MTILDKKEINTLYHPGSPVKLRKTKVRKLI